MEGTINEEYLFKLCKLGTIAELEKIKAEILSECPNTNARMICISILYKHISELKGENKQSRCNNCQNNTDELSGECYECVKGIEDWYEPLKENEE